MFQLLLQYKYVLRIPSAPQAFEQLFECGNALAGIVKQLAQLIFITLTFEKKV